MSVISYMRATYDAWSWRRVRLLAMPLPPIPVRELIYRPDAFGSATFDNQYDLNDLVGITTKSYRTLGVVPSKNGPAILISIPLSELIGFNDEDGTLTVKRQSICATVSYQVKHSMRTGTVTQDFPDNIVIKALNFASSCNPGSHLTVPDAPHMTALLQYVVAPLVGQPTRSSAIMTRVTYLTPNEGRDLYPHFDFSSNRVIDEYVASCAVQSKVKLYTDSLGIGDWVAGYLQTMRNNRHLLEVESNVKERLSRFIGQS